MEKIKVKKTNEATRFKPGVSGNPAGGNTSKRHWMNKILNGRQADILEKATEMALEGNPKMIELLMNRCLPPAPQDEPVDVDIKGKSFKEQGDAVIDSMAEGKITPREAFAVLSTIQGNIKITECTEIIERIRKLEETTGIGK